MVRQDWGEKFLKRWVSNKEVGEGDLPPGGCFPITFLKKEEDEFPGIFYLYIITTLCSDKHKTQSNTATPSHKMKWIYPESPQKKQMSEWLLWRLEIWHWFFLPGTSFVPFFCTFDFRNTHSFWKEANSNLVYLPGVFSLILMLLKCEVFEVIDKTGVIEKKEKKKKCPKSREYICICIYIIDIRAENGM